MSQTVDSIREWHSTMVELETRKPHAPLVVPRGVVHSMGVLLAEVDRLRNEMGRLQSENARLLADRAAVLRTATETRDALTPLPCKCHGKTFCPEGDQ